MHNNFDEYEKYLDIMYKFWSCRQISAKLKNMILGNNETYMEMYVKYIDFIVDLLVNIKEKYSNNSIIMKEYFTKIINLLIDFVHKSTYNTVNENDKDILSLYVDSKLRSMLDIQPDSIAYNIYQYYTV